MRPEAKADKLRYMLATDGWSEIVKPALSAAIANATHMLITGTRSTAEKGITDEALKGRIIALDWVLEWENNLELLVQQLDAMEKARTPQQQEVPGGSPYDA